MDATPGALPFPQPRDEADAVGTPGPCLASAFAKPTARQVPPSPSDSTVARRMSYGATRSEADSTGIRADPIDHATRDH
jgi:hypothetical protein